MHTLFKVGQDGKTPRERMTGRGFSRPLVQFAQKVMFEERPRRQPRTGQHAGKMEAKFEEGAYMGIDTPSGMYLIANRSGDVVKSKLIKQVPEEEKWDLEFLRHIKGVPWMPEPSLSPGEEEERMMEEQAEHELPPVDPEADQRIEERRAMRITKGLLDEHGRDPNCKGCRASRGGKLGIPHTRECRERIEQKVMERSTEDKARIERQRAERTAPKWKEEKEKHKEAKTTEPERAERGEEKEEEKRRKRQPEGPEEEKGDEGKEEEIAPAVRRRRVDEEGKFSASSGINTLYEWELQELAAVHERLGGGYVMRHRRYLLS